MEWNDDCYIHTRRRKKLLISQRRVCCVIVYKEEHKTSIILMMKYVDIRFSQSHNATGQQCIEEVASLDKHKTSNVYVCGQGRYVCIYSDF